MDFENPFDTSNSHISISESMVNSFSVSDGHDVELELTALLRSDLVRFPRFRAQCTGIAAPIMGNDEFLQGVVLCNLEASLIGKLLLL